MAKYTPVISKTKYLAGLQCGKLLWHHYNAKSRIPPVDAATQAVFDQGHQVGELAKTLYPGGVEIAKGIYAKFDEIERQSAAGLSARKTLFEPGYRFGNAFARIDILDPAGIDQWDIIEVKSSTEVKEVHLADMALQRYILEGIGLRIRNCYILHINNEYVRRGAIEPKKLFRKADITADVSTFLPRVAGDLDRMAKVIAEKTFPPIAIGPHCDAPYTCALKEMCWSFLPEDNVLTLYRAGGRGWELLGEGIEKIVGVPSETELSEHQRIQLKALTSGKPVVDRGGIREFLAGLKYPLYYLDFETINAAIPLFDLSRPYQQIPFQFSLHVVETAKSKPRHYGFLAEGGADPRPELLRRLKELLGEKGSIVAYFAPFEQTRLAEACEAFPDFKKWNEKIQARFVDLLVPFRAFHYYHPQQHGSASIKAVYPALIGKGYSDLAISDGGVASLEYMRVTFGNVPAEERARVRRSLEEYCATDTIAMVEIVEALKMLAGSSRAQLSLPFGGNG